ncbi:TetR/AcrR family transcriptional regulator [Mycobacterium riyadhense]|uniref:TetR family transcriptional regulator n=1 Tax=Mycobacterium riyadhense TaxID=486698 RepID=A0A1X2CLA4_9MYCO|nr:TetR/AcrR family transcriptional regulator [Mycobacterium riyadhense]MCV7148213.1 TetR/AcrR family transcriptional regulator [Mycobacterium riyadhense]ORW76582.1 TetR family transcriptional regulator [Mycobacterium riyadhense]
MTEPLGRSARKRMTILSAGRELFLGNGYQGTSVDAIAASAEVSKQTVYKHFGDKHELLMAIVNEALETTVSAFVARASMLAETTDLEKDLIALAGDYLRAVLQEPVVQLRRLVVGEANRLPDLAALYYDRAPSRMLSAFADCFARLDQRGLLEVREPDTAAEHFAFLVVGRCIDQALFYGGPRVESAIDVDRHSQSAVRVFLAGYRPAGKARRR